MHREIEKKVFYQNGQWLPANQFQPALVRKSDAAYEVVRVMDGVPLFLEAHLERLKRSAALLGHSFPLDEAHLSTTLRELIRQNNVLNHNAKIVVSNLDSERPNLLLFFVTTSYPSQKEQREGVPVILFSGERTNPQAKVIATDFRAPILRALDETGAYEALLVNEVHEVTEGSRSNLFVVHRNQFYTAPAESVLRGVTRQCVMTLIRRLGYPLHETPVSRAFLKTADGLFLTGTSPGVLPVRRVDDTDYPSASLPPIQSLQKLYDHFVRTYIQIHR